MLPPLLMACVVGHVMCYDSQTIQNPGQDITINIGNNANADFVLFSVGSETSFSPTVTSVIPMEVIYVNEGGHFHSNDNCFHAPFAGIYSFSFSGLSQQTSPLSLHLYRQKVGGARVVFARAYDSTTGNHNGAGASVSVKLDQGEIVSLWTWANHLLHSGPPPHGPLTLFSGKLEKRLA